MAIAPPLFAAFVRQLNKAVDDTKAEYRMSVQVKGLADIVRQAKTAIDTAGNAAVRLQSSAQAVVNTIGQVDDMTRQLDAANADLQAAVGAMSNGGPPLEDTTSSETNSEPVSGGTGPDPVDPRTLPPASNVHAAEVIVAKANAVYEPRPVVTASTIAAAAKAGA